MSEDDIVLGRKQFYENETKGIIPEFPSLYYNALRSGKQIFNYISTDLKKSYGTYMWPGLYPLHLDYTGERYLLKYLLKWYKNLPWWVYTDYITVSNDMCNKILV